MHEQLELPFTRIICMCGEDGADFRIERRRLEKAGHSVLPHLKDATRAGAERFLSLADELVVVCGPGGADALTSRDGHVIVYATAHAIPIRFTDDAVGADAMATLYEGLER